MKTAIGHGHCGYCTSRHRRRGRTAVLAMAAIAAIPLGALAQTYEPRTPGSTANTPDRPAPDTPIPSYYQQSYRAYLKAKADAHGGTQYTKTGYSKMPDWSGIWSRDLSKGMQFDTK